MALLVNQVPWISRPCQHDYFWPSFSLSGYYSYSPYDSLLTTPLSKSGIAQSFCFKVCLSLFFFLTSLVPWVTDSTPKAFNKMYKLMTLFKSCISYYARIIPWKNSPKEFQSFVFNSSLFPHLSNNIISINFSHASWKLLIIQDSPLFILLSSCL